MTKQADFKRRVRDRMDKTGESYTAARVQLLAGAGALHVTNGDSTAQTLRRTGLVERLVVWRDVLHEGPVPDVDDARLRTLRAEFLARDGVSAAEVLRTLEERDRALAAGRGGEYMLWFEADLYDQLQLAQIVARLAALGVAPERVTLICIGEHRGSAHFGGLGELGPEQLERLPASAGVTLTADAFASAAQAWAAFRAPDPSGLAAIVTARSPQLRFLPEAFDRLGREYPSTRDGLSLTERRLLAALPATAIEAFLRGAAKETRPFLGDTFAFAALARMQEGGLIVLADDDRLERTALGDRVLAGEAQHVTDRWVGGVRMRETAWRWDEATERLVVRPEG
jgi:hypothetical protein